MRFVCVLCALCGLGCSAFALDREAFTFTDYHLDIRVEPEQQRLGVRGKITLRNDSTVAQKSLALQISSTLDWRSIQFEGNAVQFETHLYTSDIDHTGALSEAVVTLPHEVPPKGTIELNIGYEGIIPLDTTRLTRIGVPEERAKHSDWDKISRSFTAVRGIGYVAWYPIATEAASLSEGDSVSDTVGRWMVRHADTALSLALESTLDRPIFCSGGPDGFAVAPEQAVTKITDCNMRPLGINVPTFVIAGYEKLPLKDSLDVEFLPGQRDAAEAYAEVASQPDLVVSVGRGSKSLRILGLPDENDSPFVTQRMLLTPLKSPLTNEAELDIVYALARQLVLSPRPWIQEGLSHYAQAAFIEAQKGRQAALDYLDSHEALLVEAEKQTGEKSGVPDRSLITAPDDLYLQTKAMYVWWMLKDMIGNTPVDALLSYQAANDKDPAYMQKLLEKHYHRDLQWFFDDWVYHDRGLPDFRVASVFSTPVETGGFLVTIVIENLGNAGAEVPITLVMDTGEIRRNLEVHAKSKASLRIQAPSVPKEVTVNDGSVPESDVSNNTYEIHASTK